jgi:hypothetical protein
VPLEEMEIISAVSGSLIIIEGPGKLYCMTNDQKKAGPWLTLL